MQERKLGKSGPEVSALGLGCMGDERQLASPNEVAVAASYLLGPDAGFVTGSDLLIDGGVIAAMRAGLLPSPA